MKNNGDDISGRTPSGSQPLTTPYLTIGGIAPGQIGFREGANLSSLASGALSF
jgi:hypothetical protein